MTAVTNIIMAPSYKNYARYVKRLGLNPGTCKYLVTDDQLAGFTPETMTLHRVPGWETNPAYTNPKIEERIALIKGYLQKERS